METEAGIFELFEREPSSLCTLLPDGFSLCFLFLLCLLLFCRHVRSLLVLDRRRSDVRQPVPTRSKHSGWRTIDSEIETEFIQGWRSLFSLASRFSLLLLIPNVFP